jgi:transcriptional regulator with XRE-family HTH domain
MPRDDHEVHRVQDHREFGQNIQAARKAQKVSRAVVAERAGISVGYLGEVERGEKWPKLKVLRSIAQAINVSPARFFEFKDQEPGAPLEKLHLILKNRTLEQQQQVVRVVRALLGI